MFQKNKSLTPFQKTIKLSHSRCTSEAVLDPPTVRLKQSYKSGEIDMFALEFCKIIRTYLPSFTLPYSPDSLSNILESLPEILSIICNEYTKELTEQYSLKEQSYSRTSKNLVKYEELLKEKASELEEEIRTWKSNKNNEMIAIESQKDEIIKARIKLEQSISEASSLLKEKESRIESQIKEAEVVRIEAHNSKIRNQELEWKLQQTLREIEEKEAILKMKEEMIEKDKEDIICEKSIVENEKLVNKVLNLELIRETNESRLHNRCGSVNYITDTNRSFYSELTLKPGSSSRLETKQDESNFIITKQSFCDIVNIKKSLENSAAELQDFQNNLMPEFHENAEELFKNLFEEIHKIKEKTEAYAGEVKKKYSQFEEKFEYLEKLIFDNREKSVKIECKEKEIEDLKVSLHGHINQIVLEKEKFEAEFEAFQKEKLEFYEDVSSERQRIQEYYYNIEEKVVALDIRRIDIERARKQLSDEQAEELRKKDHTRTKSTFN